VVPVGIGLRDPRSQKRDLGHPSVSPSRDAFRLVKAAMHLFAGGAAIPVGALLMAKRRMSVSSGNWFEGSQVSKARPGAPFGLTLPSAA
jgi:hypothetical protein